MLPPCPVPPRPAASVRVAAFAALTRLSGRLDEKGGEKMVLLMGQVGAFG